LFQKFGSSNFERLGAPFCPPAVISTPAEMGTEAAAPARAMGPTKLAYFDDMWALSSTATVVSLLQVPLSSPQDLAPSMCTNKRPYCRARAKP
jgi:hypothetical protein